MNNKTHLTSEGLAEIRKIKAQMNKNRFLNNTDLTFNSNDNFIEQIIDYKLSDKCLFMYNRDKSILYHCSENQVYFSTYLNIHYITLEKHIDKGTYYLGKYLFTRQFYLSTIFKKLSISEVALMLNKDREKFKQKINKQLK